MITVNFKQTRDGLQCMSIRGHAASAPRGKDLVCGAVTTLAYTLAQALCWQQPQLQCLPEICIREGEAVIKALPKPGEEAQVSHTFWVVQSGLRMLAHNYPKWIVVEDAPNQGGKE